MFHYGRQKLQTLDNYYHDYDYYVCADKMQLCKYLVQPLPICISKILTKSGSQRLTPSKMFTQTAKHAGI
jgi:hypothetical protein